MRYFNGLQHVWVAADYGGDALAVQEACDAALFGRWLCLVFEAPVDGYDGGVG